MHMTDGKGVEIILNSSRGSLLEESWLCIADGGLMVEIGKKDMLDRNTLSMAPFAAYRAVDMSRKSIPEALIQR